jgi:hypothetical protein
MTGLPNGDWTHYEIEPALACLINFPRNETGTLGGRASLFSFAFIFFFARSWRELTTGREQQSRRASG